MNDIFFPFTPQPPHLRSAAMPQTLPTNLRRGETSRHPPAALRVWGEGKNCHSCCPPQNIFGASRLVTVDAEPCWKRCASPSSQPEGTLCRKAKAPLRPCVRLSLLPTRSAGATCPTSEAGAASRRCNAGCPHQ